MSDEELVRRYLLGDLPGDEMEELEKRLLSEDDLFELAEAMEADVLDDYARGELDPAQRQRVESYLAVSPEGRLRLAVIQGLARMKPEGRILTFPRLSPEERPQVRAAAIAAMFVILVGSSLLVQLQSRLPPINKAQNSLTESPIPQPTQPPPVPQDRIATITPPPTPTPQPLVVFVANIPLLAQRSNDVVPSFDIPARTDIVEVRFQLREGDRGYPSYQVAMALVDTGEEVTQNEGLRVKKSSGLLIVRVDASRFEEGRYSLTIQGVPSQGEPESIEFSEFEVRRP
jgi:hypothetical protein